MKLRPYLTWYGGITRFIYATHQCVPSSNWITWGTPRKDNLKYLPIKTHPSSIILTAYSAIEAEEENITRIFIETSNSKGMLFRYRTNEIHLKMEEIRGKSISQAHDILNQKYAAHKQMMELVLGGAISIK